MIKFKKAINLVLKNCNSIGVDELIVEKSAGKILAEDVRSDTDMPPFNKSAMDGYAVRSADTKECPALLKVISQVKAGKLSDKRVKKGTAISIMTGAPVPHGADAVIMIENTTPEKPRMIKVNSPVNKGDNICVKGEDIKKGSIVLRKGKEIRASEIAILATVGKKYVKVYKKPCVSILATGDELLHYSRLMKKGYIRNSNSPMLYALLDSLGVTVTDLGIAKDRHESLKNKIKEGLKNDMLILSGGVSMGEYDLVPMVFRECGIKNIFHKVAMKPGKPLFFGKKGKTLVFGAPGNPVSVLIAFLLFIKPAIMRMSGVKKSPESLTGTLSRPFRIRGNRRAYYPVEISFKDNQYILDPIEYHGSADIQGVTAADGFMVIEKGKNSLRKGEELEFILI